MRWTTILLSVCLFAQTPSSGPVVLDSFTGGGAGVGGTRVNDLSGPPADDNSLWFAGGQHAGQTCDTMGTMGGGIMLIQAPSGGTCSGQMVDGKSGPGMANVYWFPANEGGWAWASPCTRGNGCEYTQSYASTVPGGMDWTALNRLYFTLNSDTLYGLTRTFTDGPLQVGFYVRSHDNSASQNQGAHYYAYIDTGIYPGHTLYFVVNRKMQHNNEAANGYDLYPEDPEFNACCNGQGEVSPVHFWDGETVFYIAGGVNLGGWTGNFSFGKFSLGVEPYREPDDYVSSMTGTYVGSGQETGFGGTYEVAWKAPRVIPGGTSYLVHYSSTGSMHVNGWSSGSDGGSVTSDNQGSTDASPYGVTYWNSPTVSEVTNFYVAIRPQMAIWTVTQQGSALDIQVQTRSPYDKHWLQTGDQVTIANLCAAANGTRTVTVIDAFTVDLNVQGGCSYSGYTSSSSATMTATSNTTNFTEILIGPGATTPGTGVSGTATASGKVIVQ